jgi:hypothetical protein
VLPAAAAAELLGAADLAPGSGTAVRATGLRSLEGEAVVNNRKMKIIAAYELSAVIGWEAEAADGSGGKVAGELRMPYISEENHDEDPELQAGGPSLREWVNLLAVLVAEAAFACYQLESMQAAGSVVVACLRSFARCRLFLPAADSLSQLYLQGSLAGCCTAGCDHNRGPRGAASQGRHPEPWQEGVVFSAPGHCAMLSLAGFFFY